MGEFASHPLSVRGVTLLPSRNENSNLAYGEVFDWPDDVGRFSDAGMTYDERRDALIINGKSINRADSLISSMIDERLKIVERGGLRDDTDSQRTHSRRPEKYRRPENRKVEERPRSTARSRSPVVGEIDRLVTPAEFSHTPRMLRLFASMSTDPDVGLVALSLELLVAANVKSACKVRRLLSFLCDARPNVEPSPELESRSRNFWYRMECAGIDQYNWHSNSPSGVVSDARKFAVTSISSSSSSSSGARPSIRSALLWDVAAFANGRRAPYSFEVVKLRCFLNEAARSSSDRTVEETLERSLREVSRRKSDTTLALEAQRLGLERHGLLDGLRIDVDLETRTLPRLRATLYKEMGKRLILFEDFDAVVGCLCADWQRGDGELSEGDLLKSLAPLYPHRPRAIARTLEGVDSFLENLGKRVDGNRQKRFVAYLRKWIPRFPVPEHEGYSSLGSRCDPNEAIRLFAAAYPAIAFSFAVPEVAEDPTLAFALANAGSHLARLTWFDFDAPTVSFRSSVPGLDFVLEQRLEISSLLPAFDAYDEAVRVTQHVRHSIPYMHASVFEGVTAEMASRQNERYVTGLSTFPLVLASADPRDADDANRRPPAGARNGTTYFENVVVVKGKNVEWNRSSDCFSRFLACARILLCCHPRSDIVRSPFLNSTPIVDVFAELLFDREGRTVADDDHADDRPSTSLRSPSPQPQRPQPRSFPCRLPKPFRESSRTFVGEFDDDCDEVEVRFRIVKPADVGPYFPSEFVDAAISNPKRPPSLTKRMMFFLRSDKTRTEPENHTLSDEDRRTLVAGNVVRRHPQP